MKFDPPKRMEYFVCIILGRGLQEFSFHSGAGGRERDKTNAMYAMWKRKVRNVLRYAPERRELYSQGTIK
jgi:hypothetical protein